jgi:hypothetical protein
MPPGGEITINEVVDDDDDDDDDDSVAKSEVVLDVEQMDRDCCHFGFILTVNAKDVLDAISKDDAINNSSRRVRFSIVTRAVMFRVIVCVLLEGSKKTLKHKIATLLSEL